MNKNYADVLESMMIPAMEDGKPWWKKTGLDMIGKAKKSDRGENTKVQGLKPSMPFDQLCKELYERYEMDKLSKEDIELHNILIDAMTSYIKMYKGIKFGIFQKSAVGISIIIPDTSNSDSPKIPKIIHIFN